MESDLNTLDSDLGGLHMLLHELQFSLELSCVCVCVCVCACVQEDEV